MKQSQKIAKNAAFGLFAAGVGGVLNIVSLLIAARMLGLSDFGHYSYLLAFATVFQFAADFGLSNILVREIARRPDDQEYLLGTAKSLFWIMFLCGIVILFTVLCLLHLSFQLKIYSWLMGIGYLWLLHSAGYLSVLRANEEMEFNAMGFVFHKIVLVAMIWMSLAFKFGLLGVVCSHVFANFMLWFYYHLIVTNRFFVAKLRYEPVLWKKMLVDAIPMGGSQVLRQLAWQVDVFVVACLLPPASLGLFSGPFRLLVGITLISVVLAVPLFPAFVRLAHQSPPQLELLYQRTLKWFCLMSFPITAVCVAWPGVWIHLLLGKTFLPAISALQVLSLGAVPIFLSVLYPYLYCAVEKQTDYLIAIAGAVVARIVLGVILIPRFGYVSACGIIVLVETGLFLVLSTRLRYLGYSPSFAKTLLKPALAAACVIVILVLTRNAPVIGMVAGAVLSFVVYFAILWFSRAFTPEEIAHAQEGLGFIRPYLQSLGGGRKKKTS